MKFSLGPILLAASAVAAPSQPEPRAALTDADILNFALTLEHLEATFYKEAVAKFGLADYKSKGYHNRFFSNVKELAYDEATHVKTLTKALSAAGAKPVPACKYDFTAALANTETFAETSAILEGVGITAYLGAAKAISNPDYLTAAGSILTVESRHSAYVRNVMKTRPFPAPFDTPLNPQQVTTLAAPFLKSCPFKLPFTPSPALTLSSSATQPAHAGMSLQFDVATPVKGALYGAWMTVLGPIFTKATMVSSKVVSIPVPKGVTGQSYVVLTSSKKTPSAANTIAGPGIAFVA